MARNLLFGSRADTLLVAVKGHFLCRARWGYSREQDKRPLFGQQQGQERWHLGIGLGGWFQICLRVWSRRAAMELENWIGWACSSRVSRGNPLATSPSSLLMSKLFAAKIIWKVPLEFFAIDSSIVTSAHATWLCTFYWFLEKKTQTRTIRLYREGEPGLFILNKKDSIKIHAPCTWKNIKGLIDIRLLQVTKSSTPAVANLQFRSRILDATSMQSRGSNLTFLSFFKKKECTMQTLVATQKGASTFSRSRSTVAPSKFTCRPRLTRMQRGQLDGFNTKLVTFRFLRCQPRGRKYTASAFSNWAYLKSLQ